MIRKALFLLLGFVIPLGNEAIRAGNQADFQVLITEVLFDPSPSVGLREHEYFELYNCGSDTVNLGNWIWQVGTKETILPQVALHPGALRVFIPPGIEISDAAVEIRLEKWLLLPNTGQYVCLKNPGQQIVHFLDYSPGMHTDMLKREGGWSLELRCHSNPCSGSSWGSSEAPEGGSPGRLGASLCLAAPESPLIPLRFGITPARQILLYWSDFLHPGTLPGDLLWEGGPLSIRDWQFFNNRTDQTVFNVDQLPEWVEPVLIAISGSAVSCRGNPVQKRQLQWAQPAVPDSGELLISEILFDPGTDGTEFIECFNASSRVFDLNDLIVATLDENGNVKNFSRTGSGSLLFFPGEYMAIASNSRELKISFPDLPPENLMERSDLPALVNSGGVVQLLSADQKLLDEAVYQPDMHNQSLEEQAGVSLERISFRYPGTSRENWYSAAGQEVRATPGRQNSQFSDSVREEQSFWLENPVFSPNGDGMQDLTLLHFEFPETGYVGEAQIRTTAGLLIKELMDWSLLPQQGQIIWDGSLTRGRPADSGIYVLLFNYRNPRGGYGRTKKAVAVRNY